MRCMVVLTALPCCPDILLRAYCLIASMAEIFVALRAG